MIPKQTAAEICRVNPFAYENGQQCACPVGTCNLWRGGLRPADALAHPPVSPTGDAQARPSANASGVGEIAPRLDASGEHTPGPWEFDPVTLRVDAVAQRKPGRMIKHDDGTESRYIEGLVALPYSCYPDGERSVGTHRANALLIAAAPELLEALRGVVAVADRATVEFDRARAAIAKATGSQP